MKKILLFVILVLTTTQVLANSKNNIIENLKSIENISFNFEQNINGKLENGKCSLEYQKKIFCEYNLNNKKILVSNGKFLVIKTKTSYYIYPLEKTPLNFILDKNFLLSKIKNLKEREINKNYINFNFKENENEINLFFDKNTFNLIGWQTTDLYQNISITYLSSIEKNKKLKPKLFILPLQN